jgi:hypothetical protein
VKARGKQNKTIKVVKVKGGLIGREGKRKREGWSIRKSNRRVNMIQLYYMNVWKCHDETPYYV